MELIEGIVCSIVFSNAENGYTVLKLDTAEGVVTAAGSLPGVSLGERLRMSGKWSTHPQYGEQFKTQSFEVCIPTDTQEIYSYLASGAVKNIGPGRARDIVDRFGAGALHIIENDSDKLAGIKGISLRTARKIGADYQKHAGLRRLISFFNKYSIKPLIAARVYKDYGFDAYDAVHENPYLITSGPYGADFSEADSIAIDLGFAADCPERVSAALIFTLSHNLGNGHVFIPKEKLTAAVSTLAGIPGECAAEVLDMLCETGDIVCETVAGVNACYLKYLHDAECYVAKQLGVRSGEPGVISNTKLPAIIKDFKYSNLQLEALKLASKHNVLVLTGGPGTGKSTTVRGILQIFNAAGLKTYLCAPTGRAAKRLSELCNAEAYTIHRLLGAGPGDDGKHTFEYDEQNQHEADAVIVDECSMIDIILTDALLRALKPSCRIIMVGDVDQLPSIGPGNMFADVIGSGAVPVVVLSEIFRQAQDSGIVCCAHDVNHGIMPDLTVKYPDFFFMQRRDNEQIAQTISELCAHRLPENMNTDPSQIQVLSPTRKHACGTMQLNNLLREALNPRSTAKKEKSAGDFLFRTGDKVMQIRNNYDILKVSLREPSVPHSGNVSIKAGVFNGDVGVVSAIDNEKETVTVNFDDKTVTYMFDQLSELEPAYAITVHKSQGSEYPVVIIALTPAAPPLLTRSVLYTAMTRAKNLLILVGNAEVMRKMVHNDKRQKRYSGLRARLAGK